MYYGFSKQQVWQLSRPVVARKSGLAVVRASKLNDLAFFGLHFRQLALASYPAWVTNRVASVQQVQCAYGATRIWSAEPEFGFMQTDYSAPCDPLVHSVLALTTTVHERDHQWITTVPVVMYGDCLRVCDCTCTYFECQNNYFTQMAKWRRWRKSMQSCVVKVI